MDKAGLAAKAEAPQTRPRGRPFDLAKSRKIAEETWRLLSEVGYDALTIEAVASAVGCNRATIYRRHKSKASLVYSVMRDTLTAFQPDIDETASAREGLRSLIATAVKYLSDERGGAILHIASLARRSPEMASILDNHLRSVEPYYLKQFRKLKKNVDDDQLRFTLHALLGSVVYRLTFLRSGLTPQQIDLLIDQSISMLDDFQNEQN
jgi:AcrR family transcriptional regulator